MWLLFWISNEAQDSTKLAIVCEKWPTNEIFALTFHCSYGTKALYHKTQVNTPVCRNIGTALFIYIEVIRGSAKVLHSAERVANAINVANWK